MKKSRLLLTLASALLLASCGGNNPGGTSAATGNCPVVEKCKVEEDPPLSTPVTDNLKFEFEETYESVDFEDVESGVAAGKATLMSVADGDTANFKTVNGHSIKCRFHGINTPESTANVDPWGVRASHFAKKVLLEAVDWCLVNDIDAYGKRDNTSSQRNIAYVWYKTKDGEWRLYNLECVEQGYSKRTVFEDSKLHYLDAFKRADERGVECKYRVYGKNNDCTYDYDQTVKEVTLYQVRNRYDELGITDSSSGKMLHITALVVGLIGDNLVIRDVVKDLEQKEEDPYTTMYAYSGFDGALGSYVGVGDIVSFYCRATKYSDNIQLSDLKKQTRGSQAFKVLVDASEGEDYGAYEHDLNPIKVNVSGEKVDLSPYSGQFIETDIEIREVKNGDYDDDGNIINVDPDNPTKYYNQSEKSPFSETIYGKVAGTKTVCNLRIDGSCSPKLSHTNFEVGSSYHVKGYLTPYYNNYQIQLFNNTAGYNYVVKN